MRPGSSRTVSRCSSGPTTPGRWPAVRPVAPRCGERRPPSHVGPRTLRSWDQRNGHRAGAGCGAGSRRWERSTRTPVVGLTKRSGGSRWKAGSWCPLRLQAERLMDQDGVGSPVQWRKPWGEAKAVGLRCPLPSQVAGSQLWIRQLHVDAIDCFGGSPFTTMAAWPSCASQPMFTPLQRVHLQRTQMSPVVVGLERKDPLILQVGQQRNTAEI